MARARTVPRGPQAIEIRLPRLDVPGVPVMLSNWFAELGARVTEGDRVAEITAGELVLEIDAPATGALTARHVRVGEAIAPGTSLGVIETVASH